MEVAKKSGIDIGRLCEAFRKNFWETIKPVTSAFEKAKQFFGLGKKDDFDVRIDPNTPLTIPPPLDLKPEPDTLGPPKGEPQAPLPPKYRSASMTG